MDIRKGDVVHVRRTVTEAPVKGPKIAGINIGGPMSPYWVPEEDIVHVEPRPIAVGDTVRTKADVQFYSPHHLRMHVNAIVDGRAWCRSSGYDYIIEVDKLERVS